MSEGEQDLYGLAARIAGELVERRDWRLVAAAEWEDFAAEVARLTQARLAASELAPAELAARMTVHAYCRRWFEACGTRQPRAWVELHRHLCGIVQQFEDRAEVDDAAQGALLKIYEKLATVKDPGSFLAWADQVTRRWCLDRRRKAGATLEYLEEYTAAELANTQAATPPAAEDEHQRAARDRVAALVRQCLRSAAQQAVIIGRVLDDRSVQQLAEELGTSPGNVRILTHRALERLKECPGLLDTLRGYQAAGQARDEQNPGYQDNPRVLREAAIPALTCAECRLALPDYVEAVLAGLAQMAPLRAVRRHLAGCRVCALEWAELMELAETTHAGSAWPEPDLRFLGGPS